MITRYKNVLTAFRLETRIAIPVLEVYHLALCRTYAQTCVYRFYCLVHGNTGSVPGSIPSEPVSTQSEHDSAQPIPGSTQSIPGSNSTAPRIPPHLFRVYAIMFDQQDRDVR